MADQPLDTITEALGPAEAEQQLQIPDELSLLPLRDIVIYPFMIVPLFVSRERSIRAVDEALGEHRMILLACQKDLDKEEPQQDDLYKVGTVAVIMRMLKLPDGRIRILVQGISRAQVETADVSGESLHARVQPMQEINTQARADIDRSQREFYLRQQMKAIQTELGEGNELVEEIQQFREKIEASKMPKPAEDEALRQLKKLERMHPDAAETATLRNWMEIMLDLPWSRASNDNLDLVKAQQILDEDHYGLEKVKERIIEALAVRKLKSKPKGSILCLVGPPGVGKTSLGRSV